MVLAPLHIEDADGLMVTTKFGFTVTLTDAVPVHPAAEVPVTVYVVLDNGLTLIVVPDPPVLQL